MLHEIKQLNKKFCSFEPSKMKYEFQHTTNAFQMRLMSYQTQKAIKAIVDKI